MTVRENVIKSIQSLIDSEGSKSAFASRVGVSRSAVTNWTSGLNAPDIELIAKIAAVYSVPLSDILEGRIYSSRALAEVEEQNKWVSVPLYGAIAAGTPIEMIEAEGTFPIPMAKHEEYPDAFLLRVEGESMNRVLPNGCYALVDPCSDVERDNQPYAVCVNGYDATIKRVHKLNNGFELVPDSTDPTFKPAIYDYGVEGTETITPIGRVVYYVLPFDWNF